MLKPPAMPRALAFSLLLAGAALVAAQGCAPAESDLGLDDDDLISAEGLLSADASLEEAVAFLGTEVKKVSPGTELAISVKDLKTGKTASVNGGVKHKSASSAKAIWVAAALEKVGEGPVKPYAGPIFRDSDNIASGKVIDLVGVDPMNDWYDAAGMNDSGFISWNYGGATRESTNRPKELGIKNYFTANDVIDFFDRLEGGKLVKAETRTVLLDWMKQSPRSGLGGWLAARLPAEAKAGAMHKAGWLPPPGDATAQSNEIGLVDVASGHRYAVAILARGGNDYSGKQTPFVEYASCVIYRAVAQATTLACAPDEKLAAAPKPEEPKPDAPKPDAPKPDAPKPDAPKPDTDPDALRKPMAGEGVACAKEGTFCGSNVIPGDPGELYRCEGGKAKRIEVCEDGCIATPPGGQDICRR